MCKLYQIEYTCLHVAKIETAYCRLNRPVSCTMGITILTQRAPHKCHTCRTYDRDRWRRGWPPIPVPQPSLDAYMSSTRRSRKRPAGVEFEDDSDGDEDAGLSWDGGDKDFGIEDEEEFQRTIMSLGGLGFEKVGVKAGKVGGEKMMREGTGSGSSEKGLKSKREGTEEGWTEQLDEKSGTLSGIGLGQKGGIVLSSGLNGEDTGSSEGFGLAIDGAMSDHPLAPPPTPKSNFSMPSPISKEFYTSPYSFSESRADTTPPRTRRSPIRRKRADSFATDHGSSEDEIGTGELGARFGGYGGRKLRGRRASAVEVVEIPDATGGGVTMGRSGGSGGVAMERSGSGVPMERTVSHRGRRTSSLTSRSMPRFTGGSSYRGTDMVGGGTGLGLGMNMGSGLGAQHLESSTSGQKEDEGGDLGLGVGFGSTSSSGFGGVAMKRDGTARTVRSDDANRSYSVSSLSLPTRRSPIRRRSTITRPPALGSGIGPSPTMVSETVKKVDPATTQDDTTDSGGVTLEGDGAGSTTHSDDPTSSHSTPSVPLPTRRRSTTSRLGLGGDLGMSAATMFATVAEIDDDADDDANTRSDATMESVTAQFLDF
ncbi:hypothetical protein VTL71DRAFT_14711 [Oculimacula yallundae]|uniref:Uncharacterized protein n=1 Tax=Oculimacula yallundae TaxID=86028 RepID=A0ABR4CJ89_9HELO